MALFEGKSSSRSGVGIVLNPAKMGVSKLVPDRRPGGVQGWPLGVSHEEVLGGARRASDSDIESHYEGFSKYCVEE